MKKILYLNNYMLEDIIKIRNNKNIFSQPANNKINSIRKSLEVNGVEVNILSSGLTNNKSGKFYKGYKSKLDNKIMYCAIIDFPIINTLSSIIFMYLEILKIYKKTKIDNIIFYNYKPEVAWAAWLAKKLLHIPITVEYEDGYISVETIGTIKKMLFNYTENIVNKSIDSAILVTSMLKNKINVKYTVVRGILDEEFYEECKINKNKNSKITIMYSGGLDKERGIKIFLKSLDYIKDDCKIIISGKGPLEYKVKEKNDDRIEFLGFVDYQIVKQNLMEADILINCQLENHDFGKMSFPSKLFEYISTGNRIVSSEVSDVKVFGEDCFYFYENDNPEKLAKAIKDAIHDINLGKNKYKKNIKRLCENNTYKNIGKEILDML